MQFKHVDLIIVGQGLAGSIMAIQAALRKLSFVVIENHHKNTASFAAIGMHNPLIIKRLRKSWKAQELIEKAKVFYKESNLFTEGGSRKDMEIIRPFSSKSEEDLWREKSAMDAWKDYISVAEVQLQDKMQSVGKVQMGGWLDVGTFIGSIKKYLLSNRLLEQYQFVHSNIEIQEDYVSYENYRSKHIIFCEGHEIKNNPFFNYLPMQEVKGEILIIEDQNIHLPFAIKGPYYITPIGNNQYKIGATFEWENFDNSTSKKARDLLLKGARSFLSNDFKVIDQLGGVRPTVKDRRPLIGTHKTIPKLHVFNGLGTRGVTLGPFFSDQLLDAIFHGKSIDEEADIARFN